jgi:2-polyprenyl-6-methoxyphenol hydroxylase-like FAD-dependent oxidoreductase
MLLADAGMRVLVVDRSRYGADTLSTHALMRAGVMQLNRWGLLDHVIDKATPPVRRVTFHYAGDELVVKLKPSHGVDALYAPRRTVLDPILVDAAERAGAEVRYGITVSGVKRNYKGRVTGIVGRDEKGQGVSFEAGLVIGADGARSTIAQRVGAPIVRFGNGAAAVVYGYWRDLEPEGDEAGYEWNFTPGAGAGVIPTNNGESCVFVGGPPARVGTGGEGVMQEMLREASPSLAARVAAATAPLGVRTFMGRPGVMRRPWGPGWALVGDAGYWKDPISAHGLTDALRDAELLARAVISAGDGCTALDAALRGYQETRDRLSFRLFDVTDALASFSWSNEEIGPLLYEMSSSMGDEVDAIAALDEAAVGC